MEPYEQNVKAVAEETSSAVLRLYALYIAGQITLAVFNDLVVTLLAVGANRAVAIAELVFAGYVQAATGTVPPLPGVQLEEPEKLAERLGKALTTIQESPLDTEMQLERLAQSETMAAASKGFYSTIVNSGLAKFYTRGLDSDPCELCVWLYRDGYENPIEQPMYQHPGCCCHPVPVITPKKEKEATDA